MAAYNTITHNASVCIGCAECMMACAKVKAGDAELLDRSRIKIVAAGDNKFEAALCRQCADAKCVMTCPSGALSKNLANGVVDWNADICVNCLLCTAGCAYGGITYEASVGHVAKCDTCGGDPACVKACKSGALGYVTTAAIYNRHGGDEDLFAPGLAACQGCNSELMIRHTLRRVGRNVVVAAPPGCIPGMGTVGYNGKAGAKVPIFHPLLTNTASMLAGLKRTYERQGRGDVVALALAGDGGASDVGFQSLSGAAERGEHILFLCFDNEGYMNTGMQASSATGYGSWTSTTPVGDKLQGKRTDAKNLPMVMMMHNAAYVATASSVFMEDFYRKLDKALEASKQGFAYLHLYAPCPSGWRFPAGQTIDVCRLMVESNFVTLWEYTPEGGLAFTHPIDKPKPLESYLKAIGKYRHLANEQVDRIKKLLEDRLALLKRFQR